MSHSSLKFILQEQPRLPEAALIRGWMRQQQQFAYSADLLGGYTFFPFQLANAGAATLTPNGYLVATCTGKMAIFWTVGSIGGGSISCQMNSCTTAVRGGLLSIGPAFGTLTLTSGQFQLDLESFPAPYAAVTITIVTGPTPVSVCGWAQTKIV